MKSIFQSACALLGAALIAPAMAQDGNELIEEVIVTAQRRAESVQDVPIAVSAYSDMQLRELQVTELLDMTRLVPNLIGSNNTGLGSANVYSLRGLNNTESIPTFDPPVGSYVDDIFISRQNANNFALFDIDRIEVLRGPQGTLFGRNTTGGAVNVILKKPAEELGGYLELGFGRFSQVRFRGSVDFPVQDNLLLKLSAYAMDDDGFVENRTTGEDGINYEKNAGVRAAVRWLGQSLTWDAAVAYVDTEHANLLNLHDPDEDERYTLTGLRSDQPPPWPTPIHGAKASRPLGNWVNSLSLYSNIELDTAFGTVNIITGQRYLDHDFTLDFLNLGRPYGGFTIANAGEHDQFTQEVKLTGATEGGAFDYVAGVFFISEENTTDFADLLGVGGAFNGFQPLLLADRVLENDTDALAIYLQADYHLNDQLTLTGGARWTDETKDLAYTPNPTWPWGFGSADIAALGYPLEQNAKITTPRIALEYAVNSDLMLYASATRGFKSGGWNARGTNPAAIEVFGPEKVWSYEGGVRSDWMGGRLRLNATVFQTDVTDFQLPSAVYDPVTGAPTFNTRNYASLENQGVEVELTAALLDGLTVFVNFGTQDAEYAELNPSILDQQALCLADLAAGVAPSASPFCAAGVINDLGQIADPVRSPDYTVTAGAAYDIPLAPGWELRPSAFVYKIGKHSIGSSGAPTALSDGYSVLTASITLSNLDQDWSISAECQNCADREQGTSFFVGLYLQDPRTWTVNFRKDF
ncbi:TonB-dependent receptor [Candidatus Foliamicus sp.]